MTQRISQVWIYVYFISFGIFEAQVFAQVPSQIRPQQEKSIEQQYTISRESVASQWFDVTYYRLDIQVTTSPNYIAGKVTIVGTCSTNNVPTLTLDLSSPLRIDSVLVANTKCSFIQHANSFDITLDRFYNSGETITLDIFYQGLPVATGLGSFVFGSHAGVPWVYSLSEPYGAKDWWPCKDTPSDKADSADIVVTCDSLFRVASEGKLVSINNNGNGTSTYHWSERYPIASYLISIALTNFVQFSNWFRYTDTDSMEILNYVLPEHYTAALVSLPKTVDMLKIFSTLFGLYPFIKEKYGHAEFGRGGAMEHQTMTSTTTFAEYTIAHELAHQWFGDMITCGSWSDLWLNEGFAQYSTGLYIEQEYGIDSYRAYMDSQLGPAKLTKGIVGDPDTTNVYNLFNSNLVYAKGATVLHMLRHVVGDSLFFDILYQYANDSTLRYSTGSTNDFRSICNRVSGQNLDYFFQEWVYGKGYPIYTYTWNWKALSDSSYILLNIEQSNTADNSNFFKMPIDVQISSARGDTIVRILNDRANENFVIRYDEKPSAIILDPDDWILKISFPKSDERTTEFVLEQNFPNPFNSSTNINYRIGRRSKVTLRIFDVLGREVATLVDGIQSPGMYESSWLPSGLSSGIYFYQLVTETSVLKRKMVFLK